MAFGALALAVIGTLAGRQKTAADDPADANAAMAAKNPAAVRLHLKNAVAGDPKNAEARLLQGDA